VQATSSIRKGLALQAEKPQGLFRFFAQGTSQDKAAYFSREDNKSKANLDNEENLSETFQLMKKESIRERARLRKQKSRRQKKNMEVKQGLRSPGGSKKRVSTIFARMIRALAITKKHICDRVTQVT